MPLSRRDFLLGAAATGGLAAAGVGTAASAIDLGLGLSPQNATIDTIVVVMMENRSFDHFLGWLPGAAGTQQATYLDADIEDGGQPHDTRPWAPDYKGCGIDDPNHGRAAGRRQLGGEARDGSGFRKDNIDDYCLGYYGPADIPVWASIANQATVFDHYFCSVLGPTYPNRWYMHAATSGGRTSNDFPTDDPMAGFRETTIWDRCNAAGVSWAYYYSNLPFVGLYGADFVLPNLANIRHVSSFYADAEAGRLPNVCFVDPFFTVEGLANDDHPHADIRLGQQFLAGIVRSFADSRHWQSGALFINYDEWGGFFDTVVPGRAKDDDRKSDVLADDFSQLGFRTPATVISPYAKRGAIAKHTYDHTSILKFIEWRFGMAPLTKRDASARNIGEVLDFESPDKSDLEIDLYIAPPDARIPCAADETFEPIDLVAIRDQGIAEAVGLRTDYRFEDSYRSF